MPFVLSLFRSNNSSAPSNKDVESVKSLDSTDTTSKSGNKPPVLLPKPNPDLVKRFLFNKPRKPENDNISSTSSTSFSPAVDRSSLGVSLGVGSFVHVPSISAGAESDSGIEASPPKIVANHKCVVPFCPTISPKGFSFFPSDPIRKKAWMEIFGLVHVNPTARVCHSHFNESSFCVPKPTSLGKRRRLKIIAVPELNLPASNLPTLDQLIPLPEASIVNEVELSQAAPEPSVVPIDFKNTVHDYPGSAYMSQALSEMDTIVIQLRIRIQNLEKELEIAHKKLKKYEPENLPQTVVKKVVHDALEHSRLSKGQIGWLLAKEERKRSNLWGTRDWGKVCILYYFQKAFLKSNCIFV